MRFDDINKEVWGGDKEYKRTSYFNIKSLQRTEKEHQLTGGKQRMQYSENQVSTVCQGGEGNLLCQILVIDQDDYWIYQYGSYGNLTKYKKEICIMITGSGKTILFNP